MGLYSYLFTQKLFIKLDYEPQDVCYILNNYNADLYDDVNVDYILSGIIRLDKIDFGFLEQKNNTRYIDVKGTFLNNDNDIEFTFSAFEGWFYFIITLITIQYLALVMHYLKVIEMNDYLFYGCIFHGITLLTVFKLSFVFGVSKYKTFLIRKLGEEIK